MSIKKIIMRKYMIIKAINCFKAIIKKTHRRKQNNDIELKII